VAIDKATMNQDIEQAIDAFRRRAAKYAKNERYYRGDHDLAFATEKFANAFGSLFREFALNLCPAVCDAVKDKLRVTGFGIENLPANKREITRIKRECAADKRGNARIGNLLYDRLSTTPSAKRGHPSYPGGELRNISSEIGRIWDANRMDIRSGEVHKEALRAGDAYLIVWPDGEGRSVIYPNRASSCVVFYDDENPGSILWAAKYWRTHDKRARLNLFYPDRIERYVSKDQTETPLYDVKDLIPFVDTESEGDAASGVCKRDACAPVIANPYGVVPVFHFANNSEIGTPGISELAPAIPIQDGLNKSVLDMLVAMEYSAYRQRWVTGIELKTDEATGEIETPFKSGVAHIWTSENPDAKFGDFNSADLEQFLKVKDSFRIDIASVTGTPLHYLQPQTKSVPSGESLRRAETRFIAKVRDRQAAFGQVWADAMSFALRIEGIDDASLITQWEDPAAQSERELLENILLKKQIGLSVEKALIEAGYGAAEIAETERVGR